MKLCTMCGAQKSLSKFNKSSTSKDGLQGHCAPCGIEYKKKWYAKNKAWAKEYANLKNYGVSTEALKNILSEQNNKCGICNSDLDNSKNTHIDHCHTTGKIRGILCQKCNHGIGLFKDSTEILKRAILYLGKHDKKVLK